MATNLTSTARTPTIEVLSPDTPVNMANQWYEYATADHFWMQWRIEVLRDLIANYHLGDKLIEIGCGNCVARDQFEKLLGTPIDGCDLNRSSLELAAPARGRLYLYDIFDRRPEWQDYFSTVILLDTLEHIERPPAFLEAIRHHIQPGGCLIINVPALQILYSAYDEFMGHVKRYTKPLLARELDDGGFELVEARYWGLSTIPVLAIRKTLASFWHRDRLVAKGFQPSRFSEATLRMLMRTEQALFSNPVCGTSLAAVARKK